jgi:hypothetical protein
MQHLFGDDLLGMKPFLPDLVSALGLGRLLMILELIQNPGLLILPQPGYEKLGGIAFKIADDIGQFVTGDHQVQMVVQDDIGIDFQAFMLTAKPEGVDKDVKIGFPGEEGNPLDYRAGDEIRDAWFSDRSFGLLWANKSLIVSVSDSYTLYFLKTPPATL